MDKYLNKYASAIVQPRIHQSNYIGIGQTGFHRMVVSNVRDIAQYIVSHACFHGIVFQILPKRERETEVDKELLMGHSLHVLFSMAESSLLLVGILLKLTFFIL